MCLLVHEVLDDAVFEGMIADHYQPPAAMQKVPGGSQSGLQFFQFVIDGDAQRLKHSGQTLYARRRHGLADHGG